MACNVILTPQNGRFLAYVAELPDCKAQAESRDHALALIQKRLEEFIRRSEIVQLEMPQLGEKFGQAGRSGDQEKQAQLPAKTAKQPKLVQFSPKETFSDARYAVRFVQNADELDAVLKLRFEVLNLELNEGLAES